MRGVVVVVVVVVDLPSDLSVYLPSICNSSSPNVSLGCASPSSYRSLYEVVDMDVPRPDIAT